MNLYSDRIKGKTTETILETASGGAGGAWSGDEGELLRVAAQIRSTQDLISSQNLCASNLTESISTLVESLNQASKDSGKLGTKVMVLTGALVAVGIGQIIATAWPFLTWWARHR